MFKHVNYLISEVNYDWKIKGRGSMELLLHNLLRKGSGAGPGEVHTPKKCRNRQSEGKRKSRNTIDT